MIPFLQPGLTWECRACGWRGDRPIALSLGERARVWVCPARHEGMLHQVAMRVCATPAPPVDGTVPTQGGR